MFQNLKSALLVLLSSISIVGAANAYAVTIQCVGEGDNGPLFTIKHGSDRIQVSNGAFPGVASIGDFKDQYQVVEAKADQPQVGYYLYTLSRQRQFEDREFCPQPGGAQSDGDISGCCAVTRKSSAIQVAVNLADPANSRYSMNTNTKKSYAPACFLAGQRYP